MTVKRRVKRLEDDIGKACPYHYLIVYSQTDRVDADGFDIPDETENEALARTLKEKGLTMDQIGLASFFGGDRGCYDKRYCADNVDIRDMAGADVWNGIIEQAAKNITLVHKEN